MKTKKRLQSLVTVMIMLFALCGSLPAVHADDAAATGNLPSYKASDYYDTTGAQNPMEKDGVSPWKWDYYDMETKEYNSLKWTTESAANKCFASHGGYGNVTRMDGTTMHGDERNGGDKNGMGESNWKKTGSYTGAWQQFYPVRSFTAPKTGNITITEDGGVIEYTGSATSSGPDLRILLESGGQTTQVWPTEGFATVKKSTPISFSALTLNIQEGDILHFEMYTPNAATNGTNYLHAKWNPVVSYNSYSFMTEYQASEEFVGVTSNLGQYNPGENWDWNCYVYGAKITWSNKDYPGNSYSPMTVAPSTDGQTFSSTANYPIPDGEDVVKEVYAISGDGVGIGKYWMRGFRVINSSTGKQDYFGRVYAVRTFKAKETGEVTVSAVDRFGKSTIEGAHVENASDEKNQRGVRVMQESGGVKTQLWPTEQNKGSVETITYNEALFAIVPKNLTIDFPALTTTLQAGDKLHFELANVSPDPEDDSKYGCAVYWDPKVSYTTGVVANGSDVTFKNEDGELKTFSDIVGSEKDVTVTIPAAAQYVSEDQVTPVVAVYDKNGVLVSIALGESMPLAMNESKNLTVTLSPITEKPQNGYIKVFLWDSADNELKLMPLGNIGAKPVLGTALVEAEAEKVYFGIGEVGQEVALLVKDEQGKVLYIEQGAVDANGKFRIPLPAGLENTTIRCNLNGDLTDANCLYASNAGEPTGVGTASSPLSFQKALELARDGEKIIVMDEIVLPEDFVWPEEKKAITVSGGSAGAALNLYQLPSTVLYIHTDATFENLVLASTQAGNASSGTIRACGNVVTIKESVSTRGIFGAFYGGARNWDEVDKTETYVYGGNFNRIYGGGGHVLHDCKLTVGGNTNTTAGVDPTKEKNGIFEPYIYGGTLDNTVEGDCITTITGNAAALYLYGGSQDDKTNSDRGAGVKGKTVVNLEGGKFMNVYGMNPPSPKTSDEEVNYTADVTINMTGGTVEALIGSTGDTLASTIKANIVINALGGTVTRRIMGGVYNDLQKSGRKNITGTTAVRIGGGMKGLTDNQIGNGIIAGTRTETKPEDETATLIFLDGTYEKYKKNITYNNGGSYSDGVGADWCNSNYNYLVTGTTGGDIMPESGNQITVTPDDGYTAYIGGAVVPAGEYTLVGKQTNIAFTNDGQPPLIPVISDLSGTADASGVQVAISYTAAADTNILILALYEDKDLAAILQSPVQKGIHTNQEIPISYVLKSGTPYTLKAFLWNGMENIVPLCGAKDAPVE